MRRLAFAALPVVLIACAGVLFPQHSASASPQADEQRGNCEISGIVVNASTGAPLDRVEVSLSITGDGGGQIGQVATNAQGTFRFGGLPQGKYRLKASRRGYISSGYQDHDGFSTAIVTGPDLATNHLRFPITPYGVIDGAILDDNGDPVAGAQVRLFRQDEAKGEGKIIPAGQQISDDRGTFEFPNLKPGNYFLCVAGSPWYAFRPAPQLDENGNPRQENQQASRLDVAYPLTFYPNATDSSGATPVPVRGGDHLQINFTLQAVPGVHIRVRVPLNRNGLMGIPQLTQDAFGSAMDVAMPQVTSTGGQQHVAFVEYTSLAPGHYELRRDQQNIAAVDTITSNTVDAPTSAANAEVTGKVAMTSGGPLPERLTIIARATSDQTTGRSARVSSDGTFTLQAVPPGVYDVTIGGGSGAFVVSQMAASGAEVQGNRVTVGTEPVLLAAMLAKGSATINGFVQSGGKGIGGVMVLLLPDDTNAPTGLLRRDQSDSDGSFTLRRIVPGNYTLVAIENGWTLEWANRDAIASYLARGTKIKVTENQQTIDLPGPVAVQER